MARRKRKTEKLILIACCLAAIAAFLLTAGVFYPNPLLFIFGHGAGDRVGDGTLDGWMVAIAGIYWSLSKSIIGTVMVSYFGFRFCDSLIEILLDRFAPIPRNEWGEAVAETESEGI